MADDFQDWLRTSGEGAFGGIVKAAAKSEMQRLSERLENGSLFPHLEHEDRVAMEKAEHTYAQGDRMVKRYRHRKTVISALTPSTIKNETRHD